MHIYSFTSSVNAYKMCTIPSIELTLSLSSLSSLSLVCVCMYVSLFLLCFCVLYFVTNSYQMCTIFLYGVDFFSVCRLVDSRDIMELELKQLGCELLIRKKEALPQPPATASVITMQPPHPHSMLPYQPPPAQVVAPASTAPSVPTPALPAPAQTSKSSHPPLKCPMAGTFYQSPGPGEPPFVKVSVCVSK